MRGNKKLRGLLIFILFLYISPIDSQNFNAQEFVNLESIKHIVIDLRYAGSNNFMGENLYGDFKKAYLHPLAAEKLKTAANLLQKKKPGWKLLIFDALRPLAVQRKLFSRVKGTNKEAYVANPEYGSVHNFGFAVDIGLLDEKGQEVDMGTPFDDFTQLAQPALEEQFLKSGKLTEIQVKNRKLLRNAMEEAGFIQLPLEWWHFDALPGNEVRKKYNIVK